MEQLYKSLPALIAIPSAPNFAMTRQWQSWREVIAVCTRKESCNFRLLVDRRLSGLPKGPQFRENSEMGGGGGGGGLRCWAAVPSGGESWATTAWRHEGRAVTSQGRRTELQWLIFFAQKKKKNSLQPFLGNEKLLKHSTVNVEK